MKETYPIAGADIDKAVSLQMEEEEEGGTMDLSTDETYLHQCICSNRSHAVFDFLLDHGAKVLKTDNTGKSALHVACDPQFYEPHFVDSLLRYGGLTHACDEDGDTVLSHLLECAKTGKQGAKHSLDLLFQAGYDFSKDPAMSQENIRQFALDNSSSASDLSWLFQMVLEQHSSVQTLKQMCRWRIRKSMGSKCRCLSQLPLPQKLVEYLELR